MSRFRRRRVLAACALPAAIAVALVGPGAASAFPGVQCSGEDIKGKGATFQELAQITLWTPAFEDPANVNTLTCNSKNGSLEEREVEYTGVGSGPGLKSWGQEHGVGEINYGPTNNYIGTDEPPNQKQKEEIEKQSSLFKIGTSKLLQTVPTLQGAVTVSIHLPTGCKEVSGGPTPGRIAMKHDTVEDVFAGEMVEWKKILNGAKLLPKGCNEKVKGVENETVKRVVRTEGSGTTSIFKKYLDVVNKNKKVLGALTWKQLAESANNVVWPKEGPGEDPVIRGAKNSGVAAETAAHPSSIGYVNLADARKNGSFTEAPGTGGPKTALFWATVENGAGTYADPATNGPAGAKGSANCEATVYSNGKKAFPPKSTDETWNEVTTELKEANYVICGFTYDLTLKNFKSFKSEAPNPEPTEKGFQTAVDYFNYSLDSKAHAGSGQELISKEQDYLGLPEAIDVIAKEGVARVEP